MYPAFETKEL